MLYSPDQLLAEEHDGWSYEPLPEAGGVEDEEEPENEVEEVGPVEHLEVARLPHPLHAAHEHHSQHENLEIIFKNIFITSN